MSKPSSSSSSSSSSSPADVWSQVPTTIPVAPSSSSSTRAAPIEFSDEEMSAFEAAPQPTFLGKLWTKTKKEPFVPLGFIATCACLGMGVYSMGKGDKRRQQTMMRARVGAQAFTLAAFSYGLYRTLSQRPGVSTKQMAREAGKERDHDAQTR